MKTFHAFGPLALISMLVASAASAQTYYMRESIPATKRSTPAVSVPEPEAPHTYVPSYSTTYTACSGGTQSAAMTGCTRSDGTEVATSVCASSPQTSPRSCDEYEAPAVGCGPMKSPAFSTALSGGTIIRSWTTNIPFSTAIAECSKYARTRPTSKATCSVNNNNTTEVIWNENTTFRTATTPAWTAAVKCNGQL